MTRFVATWVQSVKIRLLLTSLSIISTLICLYVAISLAEAKQILPVEVALPIEVALPKQWEISWYQWQSPDQIILQYIQASTGFEKTVRFDTKTGTVTSLGLSDDAERSIFHYGASAWQLSPDHKWLIGCEGQNQRIAQKMNGSNRIERTRFGYGARWTSDSQGWIEWTPTGTATLAKLTFLSDDQKKDKSQQLEYTLPNEARIIGFTTQKTLLLVSPFYPDKGWIAQIVALDSNVQTRRQWTLRIPNLLGIQDGAISPDLKRICWLAATEPAPQRLPPHAHVSPYLGKVEANIWISDIDGKNLQHIATIELPDSSVMDYKWSHRYGLPRDIQWVPNSRKVSYRWKARVWTMDVASIP